LGGYISLESITNACSNLQVFSVVAEPKLNFDSTLHMHVANTTHFEKCAAQIDAAIVTTPEQRLLNQTGKTAAQLHALFGFN